MKPRDTVWFWLDENEALPRPAVVLAVQLPDLVRFAYGTSKDHPYPGEVVHPNTRQGKAFPLKTPTNFYGANTAERRRGELKRGKKPLALELFLAIKAHVEAYDASLQPDQPLVTWTGDDAAPDDVQPVVFKGVEPQEE